MTVLSRFLRQVSVRRTFRNPTFETLAKYAGQKVPGPSGRGIGGDTYPNSNA